MAYKQLSNWRTTKQAPKTYWITGSILLAGFLPINLVDILIAPQWHAPHHACDSLGIFIMGTIYGSLPWLVISCILSGLIVFISARKKPGGEDILDMYLGDTILQTVVSIAVFMFCILTLYVLVMHFYDAAFLQTIEANCGGQAEMIKLTMHGPLIQLMPLWMILIAYWLLHIRALAFT